MKAVASRLRGESRKTWLYDPSVIGDMCVEHRTCGMHMLSTSFNVY